MKTTCIQHGASIGNSTNTVLLRYYETKHSAIADTNERKKMTHQDTPHLSPSTAAERYCAQRLPIRLRDIPMGWSPGRPSVDMSVWTMEDWDFFINAISEEVPSWAYDEPEFPDTTSIDQSIDSNEFGARTRYPFGDLYIYKVPERPCQPYFNAWTPGHKGRIVLAVTSPGPRGCIEIMDFEVGKVLNSGEFTMSLWGYAFLTFKEDIVNIFVAFVAEEGPCKMRCSLVENSVTINEANAAENLEEKGLHEVYVQNLEILLWDMLKAGALS